MKCIIDRVILEACMQELLECILNSLNEIRIKQSMNDSTIRIRNARMYIPNYPQDVIQRLIVEQDIYWDMETLVALDGYIKEGAVICNVGAYIGSHSLYWALERRAKKVYAFEPLPEIYQVLERNIAINNLRDVIIPYNYALFDKEGMASVLQYSAWNIGATSFIPDKVNGIVKMKPLDSFDIPEKVDLLKINVQGVEVSVLEGAVGLIQRDHPTIMLSSFEHKEQCEAILFPLGYIQMETIREGENYIYTRHQSALS